MSVPQSAGPGHVPVEGCLNFRDAGGWLTAGGERMRRGRLYRSDDPIRVTERGRQAVRDLGLVAVFDIRQEVQIQRSPGFLGPEHTIHLPLVDRVVDTSNPPPLRRPEDVAMVYEDMVERGRDQFTSVVELIAMRLADGPVLVHCAYGKDRTGLIIALIQAVLGVPEDAIVEEYARSDAPSQRRYQWMRAEPYPGDADISLMSPFLFTSPPETMRTFLALIRRDFGSLRAWVDHFHLPAITTDGLRGGLLERS